jgi:hypothetical protein
MFSAAAMVMTGFLHQVVSAGYSVAGNRGWTVGGDGFRVLSYGGSDI